MIGIIDYGMGNLLSVRHALERIGATAFLCETPGDLSRAEKLILPGVGAFSACMKNLHSKGFVPALHETVLQKRIPILGICLGMQAMAERGFEGEETPGLGWFAGEVIRIESGANALRVPHMGWQEVETVSNPLFAGLPTHPDFYFVHSYHLKASDPRNIIATCSYGSPLVAAVNRENIFATQFHPEKSQEYGLRVLTNFLEWKDQ